MVDVNSGQPLTGVGEDRVGERRSDIVEVNRSP